MRIHLMAAAIRNVITPPVVPAGTWENVVAQIYEEGGSFYDIRNPSLGTRTALIGTGKFGGNCPRFTSAEQLTFTSTPFSLHGDFCIEAHYNFDDVTNTNQYMFDLGSNGFTLRYRNDGAGNGLRISQGATNLVITSFVPVPGTWYHVAVVRRNGLIMLFVDGVLRGTGTYTPSMAYTSYTVGCYGGSGAYSIHGRIDQFRVSVWAVYTETFSPPIMPFPTHGEEADFDPMWSDVVLLLKDASGGIPIDATGFHTVTKLGNAATTTAAMRLPKMSMQFSGAAGEAFNVADSSDRFDMGALDFCVEAFVRPTVTLPASFVQLVGRSGAAYGGWCLGLNNGVLQARLSNTGTSTWAVSFTAPTDTKLQLNRWYHVALTRYNGLCTLWIDGKAVATYTYGTALFAGTAAVNIGADSNGNFQFGGQINSVRITRNNARYSNNFSPKRVKEMGHVAGDSVDYDAYYCRMSSMFELATEMLSGLRQLQPGTIRNTTLLDDTRLLHGKPTLKMTTGGTGGVVYSSGNRALLNPGDGTVEAWVNTDYAGNSVTMPIIGQYHATSNGAWVFGVMAGKLTMFIRGGVTATGTTNINDGQWHHVAAVIRSGVIYLYVDGVREGTTPSVGSVWPTYNGAIHIGWNVVAEASTGYRFNVARIRTTHGKARYTADFTPSEKTVQTLSMAA